MREVALNVILPLFQNKSYVLENFWALRSILAFLA
jgi:hypothetical protein